MNTDPPGTDEDRIDIFVLCNNSSDAMLLSEQLSHHGYRVTIFNDIPKLFDSIRAGKPNLLICDTAGTEPDGCEFCKEIKNDYDLWLIPVLLITGVSGLSDLLKVLDSNADNFIARPYDLSELLPLIESMIAERVEKPDPEKVKTRFKIRHDDRDYVIMADRRKLLDFLLSSYELAVNRAHDLARVQGKFDDLIEELEIRVKNRTQSLSDEVERLEALVKEHSRALEQKDKDIREAESRQEELRRELHEDEEVISRSAASLTKITGELEQSRCRYTEAEEQIRTLTRDKEEESRSLWEEINALRTTRDDIRAELDATKRAHAEALDQISSHEVRHADLTNEKVQNEAALRSYSAELENLKHALSVQKDRAADAESQLQSVTQAKAVSEKDLRTRINDLIGKVKEQADELAKQKKALDSETERRTALGQQVQALAQEKEKCEAALCAEKESLRQQRDALQEKFDTTTASLGAERQKTATLSDELQSASAARDKHQEELRMAIRRLEIAETACEEEKQLRLASEKNAKEALAAKDEAEKSYQKLIGSLHEDKKTYNEELALANRELDTVQSTRKRLEEERADAVLRAVQSEKFAQSLSHEMEQLRTALDNERRERRNLQETFREEKQAKENIERQLLTITAEKGLLYDTLMLKYEKLTADFEREVNKEKALEQELAAAAQQLQTVTEEKIREHESLLEKIQKLTEDLERETAARKSLLRDPGHAVQEPSRKTDEVQGVHETGEQRLQGAEEQPAGTRDALLKADARVQPAPDEPVIVPARALTLKEPELPRVVDPKKQSLSVVDSVQPHRELVAVPDKPAPMAAQETDDTSSPEIRCIDDLFEDDPEMNTADLPNATKERRAAGESAADPGAEAGGGGGPVEPEEGIAGTDSSPEAEKEESGEEEAVKPAEYDAGAGGEPEEKKRSTIGTLEKYGVPGTGMFDRQQWFDLIRWAHNSPSLSREEKLRFVRLKRLMQKGRKLTRVQEEQVTELFSLAYSMGYKPR